MVHTDKIFCPQNCDLMRIKVRTGRPAVEICEIENHNVSLSITSRAELKSIIDELAQVLKEAADEAGLPA